MDGLRSLARSADAFPPNRVEFRRYSSFNTLCSVVLVIFIAGYCVFAALDNLAAPTPTELEHLSISSGVLQFPVRISAACSSTGQCGDVNVLFDYSADTGCSFLGISNVTTTSPTNSITQLPNTLCYSPTMKVKADATSIPRFAIVSFSGIGSTVYGEVTIESGQKDGILQEVLQIRTNEAKEVILEAWGTSTQYDVVTGKREMTEAVTKTVDYSGAIGSNAGKIYISLSQFVTITRPKVAFLTHPLHVIGGVGGAIALGYIVIKVCLGLTIHPILS